MGYKQLPGENTVWFSFLIRFFTPLPLEAHPRGKFFYRTEIVHPVNNNQQNSQSSRHNKNTGAYVKLKKGDNSHD